MAGFVLGTDRDRRLALKKMVACALIAAGFSLGARCDESRERPTGLNIPVPPTEVTVRSPQPNAVLFADSSAVIEIEALGLIQAVGFIVMSVNPIIDTVATRRRDFEPPVEVVDEQFVIQLPTLVSGTSLEIRAFAENLIGQRTSSETVGVFLVDCDVEPFRCQ